MKEKMNNKGFSLVELIVVIAIMAILVGALAPQFVKYIENTNISTDMQNVEQLKTAVEVYASDLATTAAGYSNAITITVTGGSTKTLVVAGGPSGMTSGDLGVSNLSNTLKSANWAAGPITYTFSTTGFNWGTPAACQNSRDTSKDIADVFK